MVDRLTKHAISFPCHMHTRFTCIVFQEPRHSLKWLLLAELSCNISFHTSLKCTHFEALYSYKSPQIWELSLPRTITPEATITLHSREQIIEKLKVYFTHLKAPNGIFKLVTWYARNSNHTVKMLLVFMVL